MIRRYQPQLFQPIPSLVGFSLSELIEETRAVHFPELHDHLEVRIAAESPLASMRADFMGSSKHLVVFHPVLNHPQTPIEVLRFIAKHELTHIVRPPRFIDGYFDTHPPEFWELEVEIAPEHYAVWAWIRRNLGRCLRREEPGIRVTRRWHALRESSRSPYTPYLPFNGERWERVCPGGGAQLHLPPGWVVRPLPLRDSAPPPGRQCQTSRGVARRSQASS